MTDKEKLSKTVIGMAFENDIEITDNIKAIARAAQLEKEKTWTYKAKETISDNIKVFTLAAIGFAGTTIAGLITAFFKDIL